VGEESAAFQYYRLRAGILDGTYPPSMLLQAAALSRELGVSRTPVREALNRLVQEGFVEHLARGYRVRRNDPAELLDVFDARIALESSAAHLAAQRRTDDDLARLESVTTALENEDDTHAQDSLNTLWHHTVVEAAHNNTMATMVEHTRSRLAIHRLAIRSRRSPESATLERREHRTILDAIREADAARARDLMRQHLERGRGVRIEPDDHGER
jgi:DNA-binding GntR family transcriptional regulator